MYCFWTGGIGGFGRELKKRYPTMDVFVMEQPAIVVHAIEQNRQNGDGESSITFIKGKAPILIMLSMPNRTTGTVFVK